MLNPTDKIAIVLEVQAWQTVVNLMAEGPYRAAAPLISTIQEQFNAHIASPAAAPLSTDANGHGKHIN